MAYHARFSPSGAHGWSKCSGWESNPSDNDFAAWGTACHELSADCIVDRIEAEAHIDREIDVHGRIYTVDTEMAECAQFHIDYVNTLEGQIIVEQPVSIGFLTGEEGATGTADAVAVAPPLLRVVDLKTGYKSVDAFENPQLAMYAAGALYDMELAHDFKEVELTIVQPRLHRIDSWRVSVDELRAFVATIQPATTIQPGPDQCQWCKHAGSCRARAEHHLAVVENEFDVVIDDAEIVASRVAEAKARLPNLEPEELATLMPNLDHIIDWCNAVRAEVTTRILGGKPVPGYKAVEGKKGNRAWGDETAVEKLRRRFSKIVPKDDFYTAKLISPTQAEKLLKKAHPEAWDKFNALVVQPAGNHAVVPVSDKREALALGNAADEFVAIEEEGKEG